MKLHKVEENSRQLQIITREFIDKFYITKLIIILIDFLIKELDYNIFKIVKFVSLFNGIFF